jgi:hypothetical protein
MLALSAERLRCAPFSRRAEIIPQPSGDQAFAHIQTLNRCRKDFSLARLCENSPFDLRYAQDERLSSCRYRTPKPRMLRLVEASAEFSNSFALDMTVCSIFHLEHNGDFVSTAAIR